MTSPFVWADVVLAQQSDVDAINALGNAVEQHEAAWTPYTPTWSSSGTAPVLGNGSITGAYKQRGKPVIARGSLTFGSTSTFGTGSYRVSVPIAATAAAQNESVGTLWLLDSGVLTKIGTCTFVGSTSLWLVSAAGGDINPTVPHAWNVNDAIRWTIEYEGA